jgi:hypothetical protein
MISKAIDPAHTAMFGLDLEAGVVSIYTRDYALVTRVGALLKRDERRIDDHSR